MGNLIITNKGDQRVRELADRHYSRQSIGNVQFCRPGKNIILKTKDSLAAFVFWNGIADHEYLCWENTLFRNESKVLSSELLREASAHMFFVAGIAMPRDGLISYVNKTKVRSVNPGCCYKKAGWKCIRETDKFRIFQLLQCEAVEIPKSQLDLL